MGCVMCCGRVGDVCVCVVLSGGLCVWAGMLAGNSFVLSFVSYFLSSKASIITDTLA